MDVDAERKAEGGALAARADAGASAMKEAAPHDFIAVSLSDISDLKAREASFRLLFDGNPIPTALCDPESYGFLAVNDAAAALWGYSREALLAMSLYDVALEEDWDEMRQCSKQAPAGPVNERLLASVIESVAFF
jgi:PAS domain-containing protein